MKLTYKIAIRLSVVIMLLLALWTTIFYFAIVDEINDETDDALEDYTELVIMRMLAGKQLPQEVGGEGSNNTYVLVKVTEEYANSNERIQYYDADVYIPEKREFEPARVLATIFTDEHSNWYRLTVSIPSFEKEDLLNTIMIWILCLYIVVLVSGISVTMWVFYKGISPLYELLRWLDNYVPGQKENAVPNNTNIKEFNRLNRAVEEATNRSEKAYYLQKQFIGNASHELQTPLAVLGTRMERVLNSWQLTEEQMAEIISMLQTQRHAVRLNKDLLLLTKIDNCQFTDNSDVDIVQIIEQQQSMYAEVFEEKEIVCNIDLPQNFIVRMNSSLAGVLITNLIRNAYIHSKEGAVIDIELKADCLKVSNTATGEPLDGSRIFERFYQGTKKEGSTGLGLSIVKAICDSYELQLDYKFNDKKHNFYVKFFKK